MIEERPRKFSPEDVEYRESEEIWRRCLRCIHFFERKSDRYCTCEIMRPEKDSPVDPDYVCSLFTKDGEEFPLYPGSR
jgi:hypothetical protein